MRAFKLPGPALEHALGDDDHVARGEHDVGAALAVLEQVAEAQRVLALAAERLVEADQLGAVAARRTRCSPPTAIIASSSVMLAR